MDLTSIRLQRQQISRQDFDNAGELLQYMGAMQGQDYLAALWAIGLRLPGFTDKKVEEAIADKQIVRSWAMRATLHFLPTADIRWILKLVGPRIANKYAAHYNALGLDKTILAKSYKLLEKTLAGEKQFTRKELMEVMAKKGIPTGDIRPGLILLDAALKGLICFGKRRGKEFTYTLLEEWLPEGNKLEGDEALAELAFRYFNSHGPATLHDFSWWSGLTVAQAKTAVTILGEKLSRFTLQEQDYWMTGNPSEHIIADKHTFLLPDFDEYLVSYKDRSAAASGTDAELLIGRENSIFNPVIVCNGKVKGFWKRTLKKDLVTISTRTFDTSSVSRKKSIAAAAKNYAQFLEMSLKMED